MKDHLAHGLFGKLSYWSSSKKTHSFCFSPPSHFSWPAGPQLGWVFFPWTVRPVVACVDSAVDLVRKWMVGESKAEGMLCEMCVQRWRCDARRLFTLVSHRQIEVCCNPVFQSRCKLKYRRFLIYLASLLPLLCSLSVVFFLPHQMKY